MKNMISLFTLFFFCAMAAMAVPENGAFGKVQISKSTKTGTYNLAIPVDRWQFDPRCEQQCFLGDEQTFFVTIVHFMDNGGKILPAHKREEHTLKASLDKDGDYIKISGISKTKMPKSGNKILVYYQSTDNVFGWITDVNALEMPEHIRQSEAAKHNAAFTYHKHPDHGFLLPVP